MAANDRKALAVEICLVLGVIACFAGVMRMVVRIVGGSW